jgi:hypothetical protein
MQTRTQNLRSPVARNQLVEIHEFELLVVSLSALRERILPFVLLSFPSRGPQGSRYNYAPMIYPALRRMIQMKVLRKRRVYSFRKVSSSSRAMPDTSHENGTRLRDKELPLELPAQEVFQSLALPERPSYHPMDMQRAVVPSPALC